MFIAKIGGGLFVPNHFIRCFHPHTSMIGCQHNLNFFICYFFQCLVQRRMFKPARGNTPVAHFITGQFFQHFHFRSGMAKHIHKIVNDNIQIIVQQVVNIIYQVQTGLVIQNLWYKKLSDLPCLIVLIVP